MENNMIRPALPKKLYYQIEEIVVNLYIELELKAPIEPKEIAKKLGYVVRYLSEFTQNELIVSSLRGQAGQRKDGLSYYDPTIKTYVIWVNDIDVPFEEHSNFTIMHEIGHIKMEHKVDSPLAEMIANYFAAYAFVPSPLPSLLKCSTYVEIANAFYVSLECALFCMQRYTKWSQFGGKEKSYEVRLRTYYKNLMKGEINIEGV